MPQSTITFELGGHVDIERMDQGITAFRKLIVALTGKAKVTWVVEDLQPGSAMVTVRGEGQDPDAVHAVVQEYAKIGKALQNKESIPGSYRIIKSVNAVKKLAASQDYVRLETSESSYLVYDDGKTPLEPAITVAIGAVAGRVQVLSNRGRLRFNLYDTVHDKAVSCYLSQGQEELMREAWGQRATVSGQVYRDRATGRPLAVRQIMGIEILQEIASGSYREARGAVSWQPGNMLPEDAIRRLRDA